jgi:hypothetical protein
MALLFYESITDASDKAGLDQAVFIKNPWPG